MALDMKETGLMIYKKDMDMKHGKIKLNILASIYTDRNTVKENSFGVIIHFMSDNFIKITFVDMVYIHGQIKDNIQEIG